MPILLEFSDFFICGFYDRKLFCAIKHDGKNRKQQRCHLGACSTEQQAKVC